jgi:DNA-directed RNA polymerase specialized sigma24 family protein
VRLAHTHPWQDDEQQVTPAAVGGLLAHLESIYGFALTLTGDAEVAAEITEHVFASVRGDLWATLGGHGLRDRLLARCVLAFTERLAQGRRRGSAANPCSEPRPTHLGALLLELPWNERAAIALVDQLGVSYASGAAVLGVDASEFRSLVHRGRSVLFAAYRSGSR